MELTKNELLEQMQFLASLAAETKKVKDAICRRLPKSNEVSYIIDDIASGNLSAEEVKNRCFEFEKAGCFDNLPEGEDISYPRIKLIAGGRFIDVLRPVDGGSLVAYSYVSDCGTYQVGINYEAYDGAPTEFAMAEVKKGELAAISGYPEDNKDVDLMVWGDPDSEDYTAKYRMSYDAMNRE